MAEQNRATAKAAGVLEAAYFVHARADFFRERGCTQIVEALDGLADDLKAYAVRIGVGRKSCD